MTMVLEPAVAYVTREDEDRRRRPVLLVGFALLAVLALGLGLLSGFTAPRTPPGEIVGSMPVGPQGGTLPFDGVGKVEVPAGAVALPRTITVWRTIVKERVRVLPEASGSQAQLLAPGTLVVYTFGRTGLRFAVPVTVVLPLQPGRSGVVFVVRNGTLTILGGTPNLAAGTITLQTTDLDVLGQAGAVQIAQTAVVGPQRTLAVVPGPAVALFDRLTAGFARLLGRTPSAATGDGRSSYVGVLAVDAPRAAPEVVAPTPAPVVPEVPKAAAPAPRRKAQPVKQVAAARKPAPKQSAPAKKQAPMSCSSHGGSTVCSSGGGTVVSSHSGYSQQPSGGCGCESSHGH